MHLRLLCEQSDRIFPCKCDSYVIEKWVFKNISQYRHTCNKWHISSSVAEYSFCSFVLNKRWSDAEMYCCQWRRLVHRRALQSRSFHWNHRIKCTQTCPWLWYTITDENVVLITKNTDNVTCLTSSTTWVLLHSQAFRGAAYITVLKNLFYVISLFWCIDVTIA